MTRAALIRATLAGLAVIVVGLAMWRCAGSGARQEAARFRVESNLAQARAAAGADAVDTVSAADRRAADSEALTRRNTEEIRDAMGAETKIDPAVAAAGLRSLCRRSAYRDSPQCDGLRGAHPE